ncbi:MAG: hypothetical protein EPN25_08205 [Nitrospirae bacterium]|nr:MAG: hypothetical protein EPN25_08205 [Nitrospirota bacterium]
MKNNLINKAYLSAFPLLIVLCAIFAPSVCADEMVRCERKVKCTLQINQKEDGIWALLSFENLSACDIDLLKDKLMLDGKVPHSLFQVRFGNSRKKVHYTGKIVEKYMPEINDRSDYYTLKRHQEIVTKVNLSKYFDLTKAGNYRVYYESYNPEPLLELSMQGGVVKPGEKGHEITVKSNEVKFKVKNTQRAITRGST